MSVSSNDGIGMLSTIIEPVETITSTGQLHTESGGSGTASHDYDVAISYNGREARNLAEKQRRDKLNASIHELSTMVPHVAESTRRLDKTAVLRFAAHGFRLQHVFGKTAGQRKLQKHEEPQIAEMLLELLNSFLITLTCHGQIVLISETVENLLGHCRLDLYGQNILNIIHPDDQAFLQQQLIPHDLKIMFNRKYPHTITTNSSNTTKLAVNKEYQMQSDNDDDDDDDDDNNVDMAHRMYNDNDIDEDMNCQSSCDGDANLPNTNKERSSFKRRKNRRERLKYLDKCLAKDRRSFTVRVARASTRAETTRSYEIVKFDGCFRRSDHSASDDGANTFPIVAQLIRRQRSTANTGNNVNFIQHDAIAQAALHGVSGNDIVFVGMARIIQPPKVNFYPLNSNNMEYRTRHLIDGRIVDCDQRIGLVAGYMIDEVKNLSPFSFMHQDDVRWVIVALRQMYDCNSNYGESCYRLLTRNGNFIYLQTRGYLEIDKTTNKVHSFVCINTLLDEEVGRQRVQEMKNKFSVIIQTKIPSNSQEDAPASQNPQQLERIVLYLIENLQKHDSKTTTTTTSTVSSMTTASATVLNAQPLALVPPEPSSVRNSISRSVSVVQQQYSAKSPSSSSQFGCSDFSLSPASSNNEQNDDLLVTSIESSKPHHNNNNNNNNNHMLKSPASSTTPESLMSPKVIQQSVEDTSSQPLCKEVSVLKRLQTPKRKQLKSNAAERPTPNSPLKSPIASGKIVTPSEIHNALTSSWRQLDESLDTIGEDAHALLLRQHHQTSPHSIDGQLDALLVEHDMQQEMLVHIKSEYDAHIHLHEELQAQPKYCMNGASSLTN